MGIRIAGLIPDGRIIYQQLKNKFLNNNYTNFSDYLIEISVNKISGKLQLKALKGSNKRPYAEGFLIA